MDAVCCGAKCSFMAHSVIPRQRSKRSLSGGLCCKTLFWGVCVQISAKALVCSLENYVGGFSHINSLISNWLPFQARYMASYRRTALFSSCAGQRFGPCIIDTVAVGTARVGEVFTEHMASTLPDVSTAKMIAN
jgi:hypothetical protein